jgi:chromosome segregation ATPase
VADHYDHFHSSHIEPRSIDLWSSQVRKMGMDAEKANRIMREASEQIRKMNEEVAKAKRHQEVQERLQKLAKALFQRSYEANAGPSQLQEWGKEIEAIRKMMQSDPS